MKQVEALKADVQHYEEIVRLSEAHLRLNKTIGADLQESQNTLMDSRIRLAEARVQLAVLVKKFSAKLGVTKS